MKRPITENKLYKEMLEWSHTIQQEPLPLWTEAFEYAYKLGQEKVVEFAVNIVKNKIDKSKPD